MYIAVGYLGVLELADTGDSVQIYRAVGFAEFISIMDTGHFSLRPNGLEAKYFGLDFSDTLVFANKVFNIHVAAILETTVVRSVLYAIGDFTKVDVSVFRSGTVGIHKEHLSVFNNAIIEVKHKY